MVAMPLASIVIPNWNGRHLIDACLSSIAKLRFRDFDVTLVDNGSDDGSVDHIAATYLWVRVIALPRNGGFSYAVNQGIRQTSGRYVALLNNDATVDAAWLGELVACLDVNPGIGFCASKMLSYHQPGMLESVGDTYTKCGAPYRIGYGETDTGQYDQPRMVLGACAGAALYRREMLEAVGPFDEDFFAYGEDTDLSIRAQLMGYRCGTVPTAIVHHIGSATSGRESDFSVCLIMRNKVNILVKDVPGVLLLRWSPFILLVQVLLFLRYCLHGQWRPALQAYAGAARLFPLMMAKRKTIQGQRCIAPDDLAAMVDARPIIDILRDRRSRHRAV